LASGKMPEKSIKTNPESKRNLFDSVYCHWITMVDGNSKCMYLSWPNVEDDDTCQIKEIDLKSGDKPTATNWGPTFKCEREHCHNLTWIHYVADKDLVMVAYQSTKSVKFTKVFKNGTVDEVGEAEYCYNPTNMFVQNNSLFLQCNLGAENTKWEMACFTPDALSKFTFNLEKESKTNLIDMGFMNDSTLYVTGIEGEKCVNHWPICYLISLKQDEKFATDQEVSEEATDQVLKIQ